MSTVRAKFNRPQRDAFRLVSPGVLLTLVFGRGVGKSFLHRRIWYRLVAEWDGKPRPGGPSDLRGVRIILLMPSFKQAVDTFASAILAELTGDEWAFLGARLNRTRWRIEFPGGSWIQFFGAENVDSARGMRCDVISCDEADDIEKSSFDAVAIPWLSEPWSLKIRVVSGTPRRGRYGLLYALYSAGKELDANGNKKHANCHSLHATYRDAPRQVSASYVESVRATMLPQVFDREWLASFDSGDRLVYPFEYDVHVRPFVKSTPITEWLVGVDFGWADAGVFLLCAVRGLGREATIHVVKEIYEHQRVESWWLERAKELKREYQNAKWYADKSQPARIEALRRDAHVNIVPGDNNIYDGVDAVADRLVKRKRQDGSEMVRMFVDPSCVNTIREFNLYRRKADPKDKERATDEIEDRDNHAMDSLRYAVFTRFGKPAATKIDIT